MYHYNDVIMGAIASQITSLTIVYSTVYSENVSIWWRHHGNTNSLNTEMERSSFWLPCSSLETLQASFQVTNDDHGSKSDDLPFLCIMENMARNIQGNETHDDVIKWKHFPRNWPLKASAVELWCFLFDLRLNKWLSKHSWGWWFETPSCSLWRHCNADWKNIKCESDWGKLSGKDITVKSSMHLETSSKSLQIPKLIITLFYITAKDGVKKKVDKIHTRHLDITS